MVAYFLRLKLRLLGNGFRRSPWQLVALIIGLMYGLGTAVILMAGLVALRFADVEQARSIEVVFGSLVVVLFAILPLTLGIDDTLDPRRFSLFGIPNTRLALYLAIASLVSIPAIIVTGIAVALIFTWSYDPGTFVLAVLSAALIVVTCLLSARVSTSIASFLLATRRARDLTGLIGVAALICIAPLVVVLAGIDWRRDGLDVLARIEAVVSWTPLGAAWASPADAVAGDTTAAILKLLIAIAWAGILWLAWRALLGRMLVTNERQPEAKKYHGLGWFDRLPSGPIGAIAARSLTYWGRDSRYGTSLIVIPLIPIIMIVALNIAGLPLQQLALLPVPVICLFLSWAVHNDVSFDNTAIWLHVAAGTSGWADRWGRLLPVLFVGVPVAIGGSFLAVWGFGDRAPLPSLIGVSIAILFSGLGLSSIMSAAFPYPSVRPGDSPFAQPQGGGSPAGLIQGFSFGAIILFSAPALYFAVRGFMDDPSWHQYALYYGVGIGVVVLFGGTWIGSAVYKRRAPAILAFSLRN